MAIKLFVPSIGCAACIETITKAIQTKDASAIVTGDAIAKFITVDTQLTELQIRELVAIAGHEVA